jgi:hypothetical protein
MYCWHTHVWMTEACYMVTSLMNFADYTDITSSICFQNPNNKKWQFSPYICDSVNISILSLECHGVFKKPIINEALVNGSYTQHKTIWETKAVLVESN